MAGRSVLVAIVVVATFAWPVPASAAATPARSHASHNPIPSAKLRALSAVSPGGTWSWQNPLPNGNAFDTITCPTASVCFAAGDNGPILTTTDGGAHWSQQQSEIGVLSLSCGDATHCIGVTTNAGEIATSNGGATWTSSTTGFGQLDGVSCTPGTQTCIGVGEGGTIAELTGPAPGAQNSPTTYPLFGISCSAAGPCAAVGYNGTILSTAGGGWAAMTTATTSFLLTVSCGATQCVAGGTGGTVFTWPVGATNAASMSSTGATSDIYGSSCPESTCMVGATDGLIYMGHGNAWGPEDPGAPGGVNSIACPSASFCLAAGDAGFIATTANGGTAWHLFPSPVNQYGFDAISCPTTAMCIAAGGQVVRTTDSGVTWTDLGFSANIRAVSCFSASVCYLVGSQRNNTGGLVWKTVDGGTSWTNRQLSTQPLLSVSCPSATICFAGGTGGELFGTVDGATWTAQTSGTTNGVTAMSCASTSTCMAVTQFAQNGSVIATTNSGATWSPTLTVPQPHYAIKCPSTTSCYAVGRVANSNYIVDKTIDGGAHWSSQTIVPVNPDALLGIDCVSVTTCFAVDQSGDIYGTTDGTNWTSENAPYGIWFGVSCATSTTTTWCYAVNFFTGVARTSNGGATWLRVYPNGTLDDLKSISCPTTSACFAVTRDQRSPSHGEILSTTDGATTWHSLFVQRGSQADPLLANITCPTSSECFATDSLTSSGKQLVVMTSDGGASWTSRQIGTSSALSAISCVDAMNCVVGDSTGYFVKTIDGGARWSARLLISSNGVSAMSCPSASRCFAADAAKPGHIYVTNNSGASWSLSFDLAADPSGGSLGSFDAISCSSSNVCTAGGTAGLAATTTDGGSNWRTDNVDIAANLTGVSCPTDDTCFATTDNSAILRSTDWGGDWLAQFGGVWFEGKSHFADLSCPSTTACIAVGQSGLIGSITNGGAAWTREQPLGQVTTLRSISCPDLRNCYAAAFGFVGASGIQVTHDGGATWSYHTVNKADTLSSVSCPAANTCFASGWPGAIYFSSDGGSTWTYQSSPVSGSDTTLISINCPSSTNCYAVGTAGVILATSNGGATWGRESSGTVQGLGGVSCPAVGSCVAVGSNGTTLTRTGAGWQAHASGTANGLRGVSCPSTTRCFAVGRSGTVLITDNLGTTWTAQTSGVTDSLRSISCTSSTGCLAAGDAAAVVYTLDGSTWAKTSIPTINPIRGVALMNPGQAWLVGFGGTILRNPNLFFLCLTTVLSSDRPSPQGIGTTVTFTVSNPGGCNHEVRFLLLPPGGTWTVVQPYSAAATWTWNSGSSPAGMYWVGAWSRDAGSPGVAGTPPNTFDSYASIPFTLQVTPCAGATISAAPVSPVTTGTQVTFTAGSTACINPVYEFWMRPASSNTWQMIQSYSASNQFHWNSTGASAGTIYFGVWAKDASSPTSNFDSNASTPYVVNAAACGSVTISASPSSPQMTGTPVTFSGTASGCSNPNPLYEFWMRPASSDTWQLIQAYSTSNQFHWNSTGAAPGTVYFGVWAKDAGSPTGGFDANASTPFMVSGTACSSASISAMPASAAHGTGARITFTGVASGCTNPNPLYEFWFNNGSGWQVVQAWSTSSTWTWNTTGAPPGSWQFVVWVRDASSPGIVNSWLGRFDAYAMTTATLT